MPGDAHAKQHHHCKSTGGENYSSAQPANRTRPSICANVDTTFCFHAGKQHTELDKASQAGQIASSQVTTQTHLFKITITQAESLKKYPTFGKQQGTHTDTTTPKHYCLNIFVYPQAQGTGSTMKTSTSHDPREHFALYILGRLSIAGLHDALEKNFY